jgi:hypothetical protein
MTRHYATTAHGPYLRQLRVLVTSMRRHCEPFRLHVLAEGREVFEWCREQPDIEVTLLDAFLWKHEDWRADRIPGPPRNGNELACARRWRFVADLLASAGEAVTLVDSDLMFWSSPEVVFDEIGDAPLAVSPHGFAPAAEGLPGVTLESHGRFGRYNGGWSYWADRRAARRMADLARECSRAIDHHWPDGRVTWGDQGALEIVQQEFGAHVIRHTGINAAPWNANSLRLEKKDNVLLVNDKELISFHFSSLKMVGPNVIQFANAEYCVPDRFLEFVYQPYVEALRGG